MPIAGAQFDPTMRLCVGIFRGLRIAAGVLPCDLVHFRLAVFLSGVYGEVVTPWPWRVTNMPKKFLVCLSVAALLEIGTTAASLGIHLVTARPCRNRHG